MSQSRASERPVGPLAIPSRKKQATSALLALTTMLTPALVSFSAAPAQAAVSFTAAFTGGAGTAKVGDVLYAKQGATVTLTVNTVDAKCVRVSGAITAEQTNSSRSVWTFTTTAPAGDNDQAVTIFAAKGNNGNTNCNGENVSQTLSYKADNTAPAVTADPASSAWRNSNVSGSWAATDSGSGVASGPTPATFAQTTDGTKAYTSSATDRVGNTGSGSVTVRVDKVAPNVTATQVKNSNNTTTVTFTCVDPKSGTEDLSGVATCIVEGTTSNSITVGGNTTVYGVATDAAGNRTRIPVEVVNRDTTPPQLSGAPQGTPAGDGWYTGDVTVKWTASDAESGIPTQPADTTITGEGQGLTSSTSVTNGDGLETTAISSPAVKIDRTAPTTAISGTSNDWVNGAVTVTLSPSDNLSGVASTTYSVNGGAAQRGASLSLTQEGTHTVTYASIDRAGNAEAVKSATVKIDKTAPTIGHTFDPSRYSDGAWTNQDVKVTFVCADQGGSGVKSCTDPVTKTTEGANQQVPGTAEDNAGNTASDTASVSIDKTQPELTATAAGSKNAAGWYKDDVTVSFSATDGLSGIASSSPSKVLAEGANQSASGTATDRAGNSSTAGVSGIDVDKTRPELTGTAPTGWHNDDVTVTWEASDALSKLAGPVPAPTKVAGEGANLSATASVSDVAGNIRETTVAGIKIDRTKPVTTASVTELPASGWYRSAPQVTLTGTDNLSGATTYYTVNGGAKQTYAAPFTVDGSGTNTVAFWSVDGAGNTETAGAPLTVKVDNSAPSTTVNLPPTPESGWYILKGLPVSFTATDGADSSGVAATYFTIDGGEVRTYGQPFDEALTTGEHTITFWSVDHAGNAEDKESIRQTVSVSVDVDAPTITGLATPQANSSGWNNTDVDVAFTCADVGSGLQTGVAGCAGDTKLVNETDADGVSVNGEAVDVAGNRRSATPVGPIRIDRTAPTLDAVRKTAANNAGWNNGDVTIGWSGTDLRSGINTATQPKDSVITGEGDNLGAKASIQDKAGNVGEGTVSGIKIDRTAPEIKGATVNTDLTPRRPNAAGWFNSAVKVHFTATDALSQVQEVLGSTTLSTDGANNSATGTARDMADNSATATVSGIKIDSQEPTVEADIKCAGANGFCRAGRATIELSGTDQPLLSGVKELGYSTDAGKTWGTLPGSTGSFPVTINQSGKVVIQIRAIDNADNTGSNTIEVKGDTIAPTVTYSSNPTANADGWTKADTTITFSATDDSDGSGVDPKTLTAPVKVSTETAGQKVDGQASDLAGNTGYESATVKLDRTAPQISGAPTTSPNSNGWYSGPVTVAFTANDNLSGTASKTGQQIITTEGAKQSLPGQATDLAGNTASTLVENINIDSTKPTIAISGLKAGYLLGESRNITCTAEDSLSTVDSNGCKVTTTGGNSNGVGTFTYTATATDKAGNTETKTGTYLVTYRWDGFLQPINDTAHQVGLNTSIFKAGSTIPAKLQVKNAAGQVVALTTAPLWAGVVKGSTTTAPVDETAYTVTATTGSAYTLDSTNQQWQYNWSTKGETAGHYYRIGAKLDDGQTYYVNIGLR